MHKRFFFFFFTSEPLTDAQGALIWCSIIKSVLCRRDYGKSETTKVVSILFWLLISYSVYSSCIQLNQHQMLLWTESLEFLYLIIFAIIISNAAYMQYFGVHKGSIADSASITICYIFSDVIHLSFSLLVFFYFLFFSKGLTVTFLLPGFLPGTIFFMKGFEPRHHLLNS